MQRKNMEDVVTSQQYRCRLLAAAPSGASIQSKAENFHGQNSLSPLNGKNDSEAHSAGIIKCHDKSRGILSGGR